LLAIFLRHNEDCRKLIGIDYEAVTINRYDNCARALSAVIQQECGKEDISFYELNSEFIRKFVLLIIIIMGIVRLKIRNFRGIK
jgi:hypothetical protein